MCYHLDISFQRSENDQICKKKSFFKSLIYSYLIILWIGLEEKQRTNNYLNVEGYSLFREIVWILSTFSNESKSESG